MYTHTHIYIHIYVHILTYLYDEDHLINLSVQMANEANLCTEESWTVRTRKCGSRGQGGSTFFKLPVLFSSCIHMICFCPAPDIPGYLV